MIKVFLIVKLMGSVINVIGPLNMSLSECTQRIELITKFWMIDPPLYNIPKGSELQCIQKESRRA